MSELIEILKKNQRNPDHPPHLSASSISLHMRCPRQWQESYLFGRKGDPSDALVIGSAVHLCLHRRFTGQPEGEWWTDALEGYVPDDDRSQGIAEAMVYHYWEYVGKHLAPVVVSSEKEILVRIPGMEIPVLGYVDLETTDRTIDFKTTRYFSRKSVKPNKEWKLAQGIYQIETKKPSEIHVLTRSKSDPVVIPESITNPLHIGLVDTDKIQEIVRNEWKRIQWHFNEFGLETPWPGNPMHEWNSKYCGVANCCAL